MVIHPLVVHNFPGCKDEEKTNSLHFLAGGVLRGLVNLKAFLALIVCSLF